MLFFARQIQSHYISDNHKYKSENLPKFGDSLFCLLREKTKFTRDSTRKMNITHTHLCIHTHTYEIILYLHTYEYHTHMVHIYLPLITKYMVLSKNNIFFIYKHDAHFESNYSNLQESIIK